ncbi:MAG: hypothetical protein GXO74_06735 [Calditrichaeota bacterium]|nr:hypothetical protein [Calditrichota bacterium]
MNPPIISQMTKFITFNQPEDKLRVTTIVNFVNWFTDIFVGIVYLLKDKIEVGYQSADGSILIDLRISKSVQKILLLFRANFTILSDSSFLDD